MSFQTKHPRMKEFLAHLNCFFSKKVCFALFFTAGPLLLQAQYERILNDPDVIWAAETDIIYSFAPAHRRDSTEWQQNHYWKSYDPKDPEKLQGGERLLHRLLNAARSGAWPAWEFNDSVYQLSSAELQSRLDELDTISVMDLETGRFRNQAVINSVNPDDFYAIRARQLLYYDARAGDFKVYTYAIAPVRRVVETFAQSGKTFEEFRYSYVPFWLKMPPFEKKKKGKRADVNDKDITWAAQISTRANSPWPDSLQRVFKNFQPPVMQVLLNRFKTDQQYEALTSEGDPVPFAQRAEMISRTDTVVTFDPETYEEVIKVSRRAMEAADMRLRLEQNWYWNERRQRLEIQPERFAPLYRATDSQGNFMFEAPLFWKKL